MNLLRAELRKLLTLPSLWVTVLLTWGSTGLLAWAAGSASLDYTQGGFLVFGVLAATSEYSGQIRATLLAMPRRLPLFVAKVVTLGAVIAPVAVVVAASSTLPVGRVAAATGYLVLTALLGAAVGGVARGAVAAIVPLLAVYFIVGPLLRGHLGAFLPDTALRDPSGGAVATVVWTVAGLVLAGATFYRRDA